MPPLLLLAPAAAGKTHWCIARVRAALRDNPASAVWVVLPDRNQAASFSDRFAAGGGVGPRTMLLSDLYTRLVELAGRTMPVASDAVVARLTQRAIGAVLRQRALPFYASIAATPGFGRALADLIAEWKRAHVTPARLRSAVSGSNARLAELAAVYEQYELELVRLEWTDPAGLAWRAVESLVANPGLGSAVQLLVVDGFDSFTPIALEMLSLLAGRAHETVLTLSGDPGMMRPAYRRFARTFHQLREALHPTLTTLEPFRLPVPALAHLAARVFEPAGEKIEPSAAVQFVETRTPVLEAREALRWLKARIVRDQVLPGQCALIARDPSIYRPYLREAAAEFGLALRFLGAEPLLSNPLIAALVAALQLPLHGWPRRALLDALRAPCFSLAAFGLRAEDAALFDEVAQVGQIVDGVDPWLAVLEERAALSAAPMADEEDGPVLRLPAGAEARRLLDGLNGFVGRLSPRRTDTLSGYLRWVKALILGPDGLDVAVRVAGPAPLDSRDRAALDALVEALDELAAMERALGERPRISYAQCMAELLSAVQAARYQPEASERGDSIYVGNMNTTRGVPYAAVAILGLSEGLFPSGVSPDPFLPDAERAALASQALPIEPRLRSDQQTLFYEALARATRFLLLSRTYLAADGEYWEPSPYWSEALSLFEAEPRVVRDAQPLDLREACSAGELVRALVTSEVLPTAYTSFESAWQSSRAAAAILRARLARVAAGEHEGDIAMLTERLTRRALMEPWSASRLERYASCAFSFYAASSLGLTLRETPAAGYQPAQLGSLLHAALEKVFKSADADVSLPHLLATLEVVQAELFASAPHDFGFRESPLWKMQQSELSELLRSTLTALAAQQSDFQPLSLEVNFGFASHPALTVQTAIGPIALRGRIDRVDRNALGELRVLDYKTGGSGLDAADLAQGKRLQLPIYALAAEQLIGSGQTVDGFYWPIRKAAPGGLRLKAFYHEGPDGRVYAGAAGAIELALEYVNSYISRIANGDFAPSAPRGGCAPYCPAKLFCWRYTPAAWGA